MRKNKSPKPMYLIDQEIANDIAKSETFLYKMMTELFSATEEQADEMEMKLHQDIEKQTGSYEVARAVVMVLPLLLESRALTRFRNKNPRYRTILPEILTAEEGLSLAMREMMSNDKEGTEDDSAPPESISEKVCQGLKKMNMSFMLHISIIMTNSLMFLRTLHQARILNQ